MNFGLKVPFVATLIIGIAIASPNLAAPALLLGVLVCSIPVGPSRRWESFILHCICLILSAGAAIGALLWLLGTDKP